MIELPMKAFCLMGRAGEDKIELIIDEIFGFPEETSFEGGYDFRGTLTIHAGSYKVRSKHYFSSTGILCNLYASLVKCYDSLEGMAKYARMYEKNFEFELKMTKAGHAIINGEYTEYLHLLNVLTFEIETDQTCVRYAINDLKQVVDLFGDNKGKHT